MERGRLDCRDLVKKTVLGGGGGGLDGEEAKSLIKNRRGAPRLDGVEVTGLAGVGVTGADEKGSAGVDGRKTERLDMNDGRVVKLCSSAVSKIN